jgi:hypothetical protein
LYFLVPGCTRRVQPSCHITLLTYPTFLFLLNYLFLWGEGQSNTVNKAKKKIRLANFGKHKKKSSRVSQKRCLRKHTRDERRQDKERYLPVLYGGETGGARRWVHQMPRMFGRVLVCTGMVEKPREAKGTFEKELVLPQNPRKNAPSIQKTTV